MTERGTGDNGNFADLFFASILDPEANVRRLTAIQAEGFRAASDLVERFVRMANPNGGNGPDRSAAPAVNQPQADGNGNGDGGGSVIEPLLRSWLSLTDQFIRGSTAVADAGQGGSAALDLGEVQARGALDLNCAAPGCARGEVWLHNRGNGDLGGIRLRCSDLLAHDGHVIPSAAVYFEPETIPMPGRSSRGVGMKVLVGMDVPAARYCGNLLAEGYPDLSLPVTVTVRPAEP